MDVPLLEQVKIQSRVLIPLIKALREELGDQKADDFFRRVLSTHYRESGEAYWKEQRSKSTNEKMTTLWQAFAEGDALQYDVIENNSDNFNLNVRRCGYAEFFYALGEPELGFLLCCSADVPMTEGFEGDVTLEVKQTIMQGASQCEFRYHIKEDA